MKLSTQGLFIAKYEFGVRAEKFKMAEPIWWPNFFNLSRIARFQCNSVPEEFLLAEKRKLYFLKKPKKKNAKQTFRIASSLIFIF